MCQGVLDVIFKRVSFHEAPKSPLIRHDVSGVGAV